MSAFIEAPAPHVFAFRREGRLEAADIDRIAKQLDAHLGQHERVSIYAEIEAWEGMSPEALLKDLRYVFGHLGDLYRFYRFAIVTDTEWVHTVVAWENRLLRAAEVQAFASKERAAAREWVAAEPPTLEPAVTFIPNAKPNVMAFAIQGTLTRDDIEHIAERLESEFARHRTLNLLVRVDGPYHISLSTFNKTLLDVKLEAIKKIERYAIVGGPAWLASAASVLAPLFRIKVQHFDAADEEAAWLWLGSEPLREGQAWPSPQVEPQA